MALDPKIIAQLRKDVEEINKIYGKIGQQKISVDFDKANVDDIKLIRDYLSEARTFVEDLDEGFGGMAESVRNIVGEWKKGFADPTSQATKSFTKLKGIAEKLSDDFKGVAELRGKEVRTLRNQAKIEVERLKVLRAQLKNRQDLSDAEKTLLANLESEYEVQQDILKGAEDRLKTEKKIQKAMGLTGAAFKGIAGALDKIGISSEYFEDIEDNMREAAKSGNKWSAAMAGVKGLAKGIGEALSDPLVVITLIVKSAKFLMSIMTETAQRVRDLGNAVGGSGKSLFNQINAAGDAAGSMYHSTEELIGAYKGLNDAVGQNLEFNKANAETFHNMTQFMGISAEHAGALFKISTEMGKPFTGMYDNMVGVVNQLDAASGVSVQMSDVIENIAGASAATRRSFRGNFQEMVKTAHVAARLGVTMDQIQNAARKTLDFESSIGDEINAELMLGQDLNLEKLRYATLTRDTKTMAEEQERLVRQTMKATEGNQLALEATAATLGMSTEEYEAMAEKIKGNANLTGKQLKEQKASQEVMAKQGQAAETFDRTMASIMRSIKAALIPIAEMLEPAFRSIAEFLPKIITPLTKFMNSSVGKALAAFAGLAVGGAIVFKAGKSLIDLFTGGLLKKGEMPSNPLYVYNVNEQGGGGGGGDLLSMGANMLGGRRAGWGGGLGGRRFLGKGGYARDLFKMGRRGTVARARTGRAIMDIFRGGSGTFVGGTGPGSRAAQAGANLSKVGKFAKFAKGVPLLAVADMAMGGYTGYQQSQMSREDQKAAGVKEGIGGIEATTQGILTGGAEKGSVFTSMLGGEKGSAGDELLGIGTAAARGAGIGAAIGSVIPVVGTAVGGAVGAVVGTVAEGFKVFSDPNSSLRQGVEKGIDWLGGKMGDAWDGIKDFGAKTAESMSKTFEGAKTAASNAYNYVKNTSLKDMASDASNWVGDKARSIGKSISESKYNPMNWFAMGGIAKGGFRAFANGGTVSAPTLGLVGEGKYNEAIVPLPDGKSIPVQMAGGGGGSEVAALLKELIQVVRAGGDVYIDGSKVGQALVLANSKIG